MINYLDRTAIHCYPLFPPKEHITTGRPSNHIDMMIPITRRDKNQMNSAFTFIWLEASTFATFLLLFFYVLFTVWHFMQLHAHTNLPAQVKKISFSERRLKIKVKLQATDFWDTFGIVIDDHGSLSS